MGLTDFCLRKPVLLVVSVLFLMLAGLWALFSIPIQLTPDVETPKISVRTYWPGASPYEIEREIVQKQEEFLNKLPHLERMKSESQPDRGRITLEFEIGTDMDAALLRITNELNQVSSYPENVLRPTIILSGANSRPIIWSQLRALPENTTPIRTFKKFAEDHIKPEMEKISGVSEARVYGGRDQEVHVRFDPGMLSLHGISLFDLMNRIRSEIGDVSGGSIIDGKREYTVRTVSPFTSVDQLGGIILRQTPSGVIHLADVAQVELGFNDQGSSVMGSEGRALVVPIYKEPGANVLSITENVRETIEGLNKGLLKQKGLTMKLLSDPERYITSAIDLVLSNIYLGGFLAIVVLYLFLGNMRSALVVALSIPVSLIGTFLFMKLLGRNINVISLAGLAFSVGMVMDAAIVVLENIDKWRSRGAGLLESASKATKEVYGAILASALTTVAVFLPVVFVQDQAGQLFKDIAIAICVSILLSFLVSTTVIPPLYRALFNKPGKDEEESHQVTPLTRKLSDKAGEWVDRVKEVVIWTQQNLQRKLGVVLGITFISVMLAVFLTPKMEYLPNGNRNLLLSILFPPPGYSPEETEFMGQSVIEGLRPLMGKKDDGSPRIDRVFFVGFGTTLILGVVALDPARVKELTSHVNRVLGKVPGMRYFTSQTSLFERGLAAGRSIDLEINGSEIEKIASITKGLYGKVKKAIPGAQIRPVPSFALGQPELRVEPILERAAAAGLTLAQLGMIVDIYTDGRKIAEFALPSGETMNLRLLSATDNLRSVRNFATHPMLGGNNQYITLGSVARIRETSGPKEISRINGQRSFVLRVLPPAGVSLEEAMDALETKVIAPAQKKFLNEPDVRFSLSGTADSFTKTRKALQAGFFLAIGITFLLLVILFEDLLAPLVIMAALPVAAAGGVIGLWLINTFVVTQPLDMLTMLGFLMMIGIVVNNPILIVSYALDRIRKEKMPLKEAIISSVEDRIRPIFMTTCTSIGGLMPLVLMPGPGSELYRGLGSVVLGGLVLSTFVNLLFVPTLFSLIQDFKALLHSKFNKTAEKTTTEEPLTQS